jgi:hypothetical protein
MARLGCLSQAHGVGHEGYRGAKLSDAAIGLSVCVDPGLWAVRVDHGAQLSDHTSNPHASFTEVTGELGRPGSGGCRA